MILSPLLLVLGLIRQPSAATTLHDADLARLAARPFDRRLKQNTREALGWNNGTRVVADYICSEACPDAAVRLIRYDVRPGADCVRAGGRPAYRVLATPAGVRTDLWCVPAVLIGRLDQP